MNTKPTKKLNQLNNHFKVSKGEVINNNCPTLITTLYKYKKVMVIEFNHKNKHQIKSMEFINELNEELEKAEKNQDVNVVILTGNSTSRIFGNGLELKSFIQN